MTENTQKNTQNSNNGSNNRGRNNRSGGRGRRRPQREPREFEQKILDLARVTRVTKGGKRMRFRTCLVIGDKKGRIGIGLAKGTDVALSVEKAFRQAKKNLITVPFINESIPYDVIQKFGAAEIMLKPAPKGTGLKSGGAIRVVLELAGVPNAVSKILGSNNKINNARATYNALKSFGSVDISKLEKVNIVKKDLNSKDSSDSEKKKVSKK